MNQKSTKVINSPRITPPKIVHTVNLPSPAVDHYDDEMKQSVTNVYKDFLEKHGYFRMRQIGTGAYGKIIIAHSAAHKAVAAIKIMSKLETRNVSELYREIELLRGLNHPNIITFYKSLDIMFELYIVMEYVKNGTLSESLEKVKFFNEATARKVYRQLIIAIEYCHNHGVVHLDIKCNNILLDENYVLKLIDFGFARGNMFDIRKFSASCCVSDGYSCIEILRGSPYQPHYADIWASGVVLFVMVCGRMPFVGSTIELIKQIQAGIQFPEKPNVSEMFKQFIASVIAQYRSRSGILQIKQLDWMINDIEDKLNAPNVATSLEN